MEYREKLKELLLNGMHNDVAIYNVVNLLIDKHYSKFVHYNSRTSLFDAVFEVHFAELCYMLFIHKCDLLDQAMKTAMDLLKNSSRPIFIQKEEKESVKPDEKYTIVRYAEIQDIPIDDHTALRLGQKAARIAKSKKSPIGKVPHTVWGEINTYNIDILQEVFSDYE